MNDTERRAWVMNHERLYTVYRNSGKSISGFIRAYRPELDRFIKLQLEAKTHENQRS